MLGILFVVADENELWCNKWYISDGEKCVYAFEFEDIVYTWIIDWDEVQVVFMDRNLWATTSDISDTWSYGYFFQWWNNYPFSNLGDVLVTSQVDSVSVYSWQNPYYSSDFIKVGNKSWFKWSNKDLWWWSWDVLSNSYDNWEDKIRRQWPCPDWYYIPSLNDVYQLFELYFNNHWIVGYDKFPSKVWSQGPADFTWLDTTLMLAEFKIPVAWFLGWSHDYKRYEWHTWDSNKNTASLWSSTPWKNNGEWYTWEIHTTPTNKISIWWWSNYSSLGVPVRCFKYVVDCGEDAHQEWWECVSNTMTWYCIQTTWLHNWIYTWVDEILNLYYTWGAWNIPVCDIICDDWYELSWWNCGLETLDCGSELHQEWTWCVSNYRMDYCLELQTIVNGSYVWTQEQIQVERSGGDWIIPECEIVCDDWYELSWWLCHELTVSIIFETYSWTAVASITWLEIWTDISNFRPIPDPKLKNHMFAWWFDASGNRFEFEWTQLWDTITLYARFLEFEDIVYTWNLSWQEISITLMDRNFWAIATWVGMSAGSGSYGYYYQWWNNHGFYWKWDLTWNVKVQNVWIYGPLNEFYGKTYIISSDLWSDTYNYNLWWWSWDDLSNSYDNWNLRFNRQWPCPKWYHIPSLKEWYTLLLLYLENNWYSDETWFPSSVWTETSADFFLEKVWIDGFLSTFNIPVAWRILWWYSYQRYSTYTAEKNVAHFWTSTPNYDNKNAFGVEAQVWNKWVAISNPKINIWWWPAIVAGSYPVRCFKNYDDHTITWVDDDWTVLEIDDDVFEWEMPEYYWETPVKAEDANYTYEFSGWSEERVAATQDAVYTAVYLSIPKVVYSVTWQNYDGTILEFDTGLSVWDIPEYNWSIPIKPSDSEYNYVFIWWNPEITWIVDDMYYTAVFSWEEIGCELGYHKEDGECTGNTKYVPCTLEWAPTHATYSWEDLLIYWDGTGRSIPERCTWSCDENYHKNGDVCELDTYTLSFYTSGWVAVASQIVEYSSIVVLPWTTKVGYQFSWWYNQLWEFVWVSGTNFVYDVTWDILLYAKWIANTGTHYMVRHWLQNADDDLYTELVSDRDTLTWTTDTQTQAVARNYSWFIASGFSQTGILWDESTVVDIYYDREIYTITIDLNWWTWVSSLTWRYWQTISAPVVTKEDYVFKKWIPNFPSTMPLYWTSVRAVWGMSDADISINIVLISGNNFDLWTVKVSNNSQTITWSLWENSFQLVDNKWGESGYFVTVSVSPLIWQINSIHQIWALNVKLKSQWITTISGVLAEDIWIISNLTSWTTAVNPITYLTRPDIVVQWDPMTWVYWDNLQLQVTIPAHSYPDQYLWTITYTLYE